MLYYLLQEVQFTTKVFLTGFQIQINGKIRPTTTFNNNQDFILYWQRFYKDIFFIK